MTLWLKQSTATTLVLGPFVDDTDGKTAETALTISQADVRLSKNGATPAQKNDATSATHLENGYYSIPLNTTDTDTAGRLKVMVSESGALPVWADCLVLPATVFDAFVSGTGNGIRAAVQTIATDAVNAAALASDAVTEIQTGLSTLNAAGVRSAVGLASANLDTQLSTISGYIDTEVGTLQTTATAIKAKTDTLPASPASETTLATIAAYLDTEIAAILEDTGTTLPAQIAALNNLSAADVNAQVLDVLTVDTFAEPSSVPAATSTILAKINWLFALARNKISQTSTTQSLKADNGTTDIATATVSDDGTTLNRAEWV